MAPDLEKMLCTPRAAAIPCLDQMREGMGKALKIKDGLSAEALRREARREKDGRAAARMYAIAHALDGLSRAAGRCWHGTCSRRCGSAWNVDPLSGGIGVQN